MGKGGPGSFGAPQPSALSHCEERVTVRGLGLALTSGCGHLSQGRRACWAVAGVHWAAVCSCPHLLPGALLLPSTPPSCVYEPAPPPAQSRQPSPPPLAWGPLCLALPCSASSGVCRTPAASRQLPVPQNLTPSPPARTALGSSDGPHFVTPQRTPCSWLISYCLIKYVKTVVGAMKTKVVNRYRSNSVRCWGAPISDWRFIKHF